MNLWTLLLPPLKIDKSLIILFFISMAVTMSTNTFVLIYLFFVIYSSLYLHELAHSFAGKYFNYKTDYLNIGICSGYCAFKDKDWLKDSRPQFYIAVAGPLSNLILGAVLLPIDYFASYLNIIFACFNLIPMAPLVGIYAMYFFRKEAIAFIILSVYTICNALESTRTDNE